MQEPDQFSEQQNVQQAMQQVLESERLAVQLIADCEVGAEQRLHQAHLAAQRILRRVDQRISIIHGRIQRLLSDEISARKSTASQIEEVQQDFQEQTPALLAKVVTEMADRLSGCSLGKKTGD